jgi:SAM-dependent methyltransferase
LLNLTCPSDAKRLREFLLGAGYTEEHLGLRLGLKDLPSSRLRNFARLRDLTREPSRINTLVRWFWIDTPQDASAAQEHVPPWFISLALECGLLRQQGTDLCPEVMLFPTDTFVFAADHTSKIDSADSDLVLWPNPTSRLLLRFTVRRLSRATLDLGTGTGIQALSAAAHSQQVFATDLNPRAVTFATFNTRLNGVENVECIAGNGFEPVQGHTFDLIVSNPPFFITPAAQYLFCDNTLDLDQLCRRLVREAPSYLNEDGYFQMLCEWVEVRGQSWQERLTEWFDGTGCDVWVMKGSTDDPGEYAEERIRSTNSSPARDAELYASHMAYYRAREVEAIHAGIIAMRRRSGHNWTFLEEVQGAPKDPFGELVIQTFATRDLLQSHCSDQQLLELRPKLSQNVRLEEVFQHTEGAWKRESLTLRLATGFNASMGLQPIVAEFLRRCDGTRTLDELISAFATKVDASLEQVQKECLSAVRKFTERGFLLY